MRYPLLFLLLLCTGELLAQAPGKARSKAKAATATLTFRLDPATEQPHLKHPATIGLRGNTPPLAWDRTTPLTDPDHDGIYEATLAFPVAAADQPLEYKYVHDSLTWESTDNRVQPLRPGKTTLPIQRWNDGPPAAAKLAAALYEQIAALDKALFDAYNARDLDKLLSFFSEDLEFYHDLTGLTTYEQNRQEFQALMVKPTAPHRELVPGSLEVYPVKGYGAMEIGAHRFCHLENGIQDCGTFKFAMVWQQQGGAWKVTRVLSYGH